MSRSRNVAVYNTGTGEILKTLSGGQAFIEQNTPDGCSVINAPHGLNEHLFMVDESGPEPLLTDRPTFGFDLPATLEHGEILTLPAPVGTALIIDTEPQGEADEDGLEIEFASPGRWWVEIVLWPYQPLRKRIQVD